MEKIKREKENCKFRVGSEPVSHNVIGEAFP